MFVHARNREINDFDFTKHKHGMAVAWDVQAPRPHFNSERILVFQAIFVNIKIREEWHQFFGKLVNAKDANS